MGRLGHEEVAVSSNEGHVPVETTHCGNDTQNGKDSVNVMRIRKIYLAIVTFAYLIHIYA